MEPDSLVGKRKSNHNAWLRINKEPRSHSAAEKAAVAAYDKKTLDDRVAWHNVLSASERAELRAASQQFDSPVRIVQSKKGK